MIPQVFRTSLLNLRRDRAALVLSFIVPLAFFSIFAGIFGRGSGRNSTPRVKLVLADQDGTANSQRFVDALSAEHSLDVRLAPDPKAPKYTAQTAEAAVRAGEVPVAVIIPQGFGSSPIAFGPRSTSPKIQLLADTSDPIAPQLVNGLLQKVAMTAMPDVMAEQGGKYIDQFAGGMTPEQKRQWSQNLEQLRQRTRSSSSASISASNAPPCSDTSMTLRWLRRRRSAPGRIVAAARARPPANAAMSVDAAVAWYQAWGREAFSSHSRASVVLP